MYIINKHKIRDNAALTQNAKYHCHKIAVLRFPDGQEVVSGWTGQCQAGGVSKHSIWYRTYVHRLKTRQSVNTQGGFKKRFGLYYVSMYERREKSSSMFTSCCLTSVICSDDRKLFPNAYCLTCRSISNTQHWKQQTAYFGTFLCEACAPL